MESTFAERLTTALKERNITAAELSRKSGVPEGVISQYKKGLYLAKQRRLDLFSSILRVSPAWLLGADVPMDEMPIKPKITPSAEAEGVSEEIAKLMQDIKNLPEQEQRDVQNYIDFLKSKHTE